MKFCQKCGKELMDEAVICPGCGCAVGNQSFSGKKEDEVPKQAKTAQLLGILSIFIFAPLAIPAIILAQKSKEETGGVLCKQARVGQGCGLIGLGLWLFALLMLL